jgi:hypothetical protein
MRRLAAPARLHLRVGSLSGREYVAMSDYDSLPDSPGSMRPRTATQDAVSIIVTRRPSRVSVPSTLSPSSGSEHGRRPLLWSSLSSDGSPHADDVLVEPADDLGTGDGAAAAAATMPGAVAPTAPPSPSQPDARRRL